MAEYALRREIGVADTTFAKLRTSAFMTAVENPARD
jgi:hypothetical protein